MLDMLGRLPPARDFMAVTVAIFRLRENNPIFNSFPSTGRVHGSSGRAKSLRQTLLFLTRTVTQNPFFGHVYAKG